MPGRPTVFKRKEAGRTVSGAGRPNAITKRGCVVKCKNCKEPGHNKKTCKNARVDSPPKRRPGRPRKDGEQPREGGDHHGVQVRRMGPRRQLGYGVSYDEATGEAMIGGLHGIPHPAWPSNIIPPAACQEEIQSSLTPPAAPPSNVKSACEDEIPPTGSSTPRKRKA